MTVPHAGPQSSADAGGPLDAASGSVSEVDKQTIYANGEPTTRGEHKKLIELIFAARRLADGAVYMRAGGPAILNSYRCRECWAAAPEGADGSELKHGPNCRAGRVLAALAGFGIDGLNSNGKEAARVGEAAGAGDGMRPADAHEAAGFGEPWEFRFDDVPRTLTIHDREGTLIITLPKFDREAIDWAQRIVDCVNVSAGVDEEDLRAAARGEYFLVRVEEGEEFYGFAEGWKAAARHAGGARVVALTGKRIASESKWANIANWLKANPRLAEIVQPEVGQ